MKCFRTRRLHGLHNKTTVFNEYMPIVKEINRHWCQLQFCIILFRRSPHFICVQTENTIDISLCILNRSTTFIVVKTIFKNLVMRERGRYIPFYCTRLQPGTWLACRQNTQKVACQFNEKMFQLNWLNS